MFLAWSQLLQKARVLTSPHSSGLETTEGQADLALTSTGDTVFTFYSLAPRTHGAGAEPLPPQGWAQGPDGVSDVTPEISPGASQDK